MARTIQLGINDLAFGPAPATLHVGDEIEWTNHDFVAHTVTARDGSFDVTIPAGQSRRITPRHPGKTPFYCRFHPNMTGTLDVAP